MGDTGSEEVALPPLVEVYTPKQRKKGVPVDENEPPAKKTKTATRGRKPLSKVAKATGVKELDQLHSALRQAKQRRLSSLREPNENESM